MSLVSKNSSAEVFAFVPSYNHAPFVESCLKSIIRQTLPPKKLLVIDDGSKDNSPQIISKILKDCPFPSELIARENRGLCATLNQGFSLSDGKYFAYLGSDDLWLPEFLEERFKLLETRENAVLGYGHAIFMDEKDRIFYSTADATETWADHPDGDARPMLLQGIAPVSSTVFYCRSALEQVRWNENSRLEDFEMYLQLAALGDFAFDKRVFSVWRHHGFNTSKNKNLMMNEVIEAQHRHLEKLNVDKTELDEVQQKVRFRYAREFLQHGDKKSAWKIGLENCRGASSTAELVKFFARFLIPMKVVEIKRKFNKEANFRRYRHLISN